MASIVKEATIDASADSVWDAVRDFGAVHTRLAPGFVTDAKMDGADRMVTFVSGNTVREVLIDSNDAKKRLAYSIRNERFKHHSASVRIVAEGDNRCRFIWTADMLPNELAPFIDSQMDLGMAAMKKNLERNKTAA
ncbi:MAG: SRPBCC family protein [Rhizobiales bacterium]|nr:SRPBCC family protein [Hyphomicrobiales bacterium]